MLLMGAQVAKTIGDIDQAGVAKGKQEEAARNAETAAKATADASKAATDKADQAYNKANPKAPAMDSLDMANKLYGSQGNTALTGPTGVDQSTLTLGKKTLLGS
jgi:membrane protein involved in colicin uptake